MREKVIETHCIAWLRTAGFYVQKVHSGAMTKAYTRKTGVGRGSSKMYKVKMADEGTPDLLACIKGKFVAIEVKATEAEIAKWRRQKETNRRSFNQHYQQELIQDAGGITLIVCNVEQLIQDLKELGLYE